ncbi:hypothetical protein E2C01_044758 [Portunus trituberculatus]|uniref:Uncharacterized protein n=1 Tax=Portunus trituberculatus TaxID=210409 RepID=A0A5B7G025_PORTR|nr:hypothetical protein [Portunus trituberculatus]
MLKMRPSTKVCGSNSEQRLAQVAARPETRSMSGVGWHEAHLSCQRVIKALLHVSNAVWRRLTHHDPLACLMDREPRRHQTCPLSCMQLTPGIDSRQNHLSKPATSNLYT